MIDRYLAVMNAASTFFLSTTSLCIWYANKVVLVRCQPVFQIPKEWGEFYAFWFRVLGSPTEEVYKERLKEFEKKYAVINLK